MIFSSSFAGAYVATDHGPETACSCLIGLWRRETSCSCNEPARDDDPTKVITLWSNSQLAQKWRPQMNRAFVITAVLLLSPFPAFGSLSRCWTGPDRCSRQTPRRAALPGRSLRPADGLDIVAGSVSGSAAVAWDSQAASPCSDRRRRKWPLAAWRCHPINVSRSPE